MSTSKIVMRIVSISFSILVVVLILFGFTKLGNYAFDFGYRVFTEQPISKEPGKDVVIQVESGISDSELGQILEDKGLIRDGTLFVAQLKMSAYANKIQAGIYTLNTSETAKEMIQIMSTVEESTEDTETAQSVTETATEQTTEATAGSEAGASGK